MLRITLVSQFIFIFFATALAQQDQRESSFVLSVLEDNGIALKEVYITDHYTSQGITHTYFKESYNQIPIYNSRGALHYKDRSNVLVKSGLAPKMKTIAFPKRATISSLEALERIAAAKNLDMSGEAQILGQPIGSNQRHFIEAPSLSLQEIPVSQEYYVFNETDVRIIWQIAIEDINTAWFTNYLVDAQSGQILEEVDWTVECNHGSETHSEGCNNNHDHLNNGHATERNATITMAPNSYEVFAWPVESPNFGSRTIEATPWNDNLLASPNGWHTIGVNDYTTTRGNNTDTYLDDDNTNSPTGGDAARADGGVNLDFSFPLDVEGNPTDYTDAALTNCFYWTNLMHDVWFNYGFDEASGNFQEENYTANGSASDYVRAEAQDGSGTCNANFSTPPDGGNPRMQMYLCTLNGNARDGDFDNGVIAHEYGHGISNRLTGGPSASGCLTNQEQMGEGWSDYFGIVMTIESGDMGSDSRGIGTWLFGQGPDGDGIRPYPYSTDFAVNPMTYNTIKTVSVPHGVGSVWSTMLWDMTWALIDEYGFDSDIYNGTGGNNIAMQLVMEGMKLQPCSPGFVDGRDAILEADELLNGGANQCIIWNAFAKRGLGYSANQGSSGSRSDGVEAFDLPPTCSVNIKKSTPTISANALDQISYEIIVQNNLLDSTVTNISVTDTIPAELSFVSASDGGTESGGIVSFPSFTLMSGESDTFNITLEVKSVQNFVVSDIFDDVENGTTNWNSTNSGSTNWSTQTDVSYSATTAWFAPDNATSGVAQLDLAFEVGLNDGAELSFYHQYNTEESWDGGLVLISIDQGEKWIDLGPKMVFNGYNDIIFNSIPGFSGNSNGFVHTVIDLDDYKGYNILVRFQMNCDQAVGGEGWWIDDIALTNLELLTVNIAEVSNNDFSKMALSNAVSITPPTSLFQVNVTKSNVTCNGETDGELLVNPQGGSGSYTYLWNDGETSQNRTNLSGGIYRVTVSDGTDQVMKVGIVGQPKAMDFNFKVQNVTNLAGDNGSIEIFPTGGTGGYGVLWETGDTTNLISDLTPGFYSVTLTDDNNCMFTDSAEVIKYSCGDEQFDTGGANADYSNNEDYSVVICSDSPNEDIVLTFNSFDVESLWDALYVHNGNSINSPIFDSGNPATQAGFPAGGYYGTSIPGPFTATNESGCITLRFRSDQFVTGDGWDIDISCAVACATEVLNNNADGYGSLKRQILCADPVDVIGFSANVSNTLIALDSTLLINKELIIDPGATSNITLESNPSGPIFEILNGASLELNNMGLLSGTNSSGGAIVNQGTLILNNIDIFQNENNPNPTSLIESSGQLIIRGNSNLIKE